ncbi:MAG TPA: ATP-binding protein [Chitinophagaceae bacterium]|nr:ATP-binding protein [Chitinophagaceae bacterium]
MLKGNLIKIAIIDDDEDDYFIISNYINDIQGANLRLEWISDYQTAIDKIRAEACNIYFIDYRLGNETGLNLLKEAMSIGCEEPIVILTGKGNREIDILAMQNGATDYLVKSELNTEKLERCIRYSLDRAASVKKLKERENKYRNLFEGSKDVVFIADKELNLAEVNDAASLLFGPSKDDLVSRNLYDFIKSKEQQKWIKASLEAQNNITDMEIEIETGDKEIKSCLLSVSFQKSTDNQWLVHGIIHDITSIKRTEEINLQSQKLAANERLMRILAHEIRNPLNNIGLSIEHFELPFEDTEKQRNLVNIIQRNCIRINQIITELLNLTKPGELVFERHSLQEILNESISSAADRMSLQKISIKKSYPDLPLEIEADKPKLKIAFTNILLNAVEAMESDKGELAVSMSIDPDAYTVSIRDNGVGIPHEYLSKLFEPFFTLKKNGMGLGLAASHSIFQSHRAQMQVESKVNEGTNFIISFRKLNGEINKSI